ncbi:accessory factor UbiK family protein [Oceaniserpentilla sp. 4NH20-0058]|uniref:accessory factor UbiK family protein n=1 Tax=Oceaniserpentilla sp. 4NH20-0058 TaxID=3127660 RepID=UPI003104BF91
MKADILEKITAQISALLPEQAGQDVKNNIQQVLARQLNKLDVVSRDEFEAQQAVLLRTRTKLEALEKTVSELEAKLNNH